MNIIKYKQSNALCMIQWFQNTQNEENSPKSESTSDIYAKHLFMKTRYKQSSNANVPFIVTRFNAIAQLNDRLVCCALANTSSQHDDTIPKLYEWKYTIAERRRFLRLMCVRAQSVGMYLLFGVLLWLPLRWQSRMLWIAWERHRAEIYLPQSVFIY